MRIAILDDFQGVALSSADWSAVQARAEIGVFREVLAPETLAETLAPFDAVLLMRERTPFPKALIDALPNLRLIITTGMRNASVDIAAANARGVTVCGTQSLTNGAPEIAWALLMALARDVTVEDRSVREGGWQLGVGASLSGRTLGVVGLGRLGSMMARYGRAFDMPILAWSQNLTAERCAEEGAELATSLDDLMARSDFITIQLVLSARTQGLIGALQLARMKPSAYLINTSRGPIIDEAALVAALKAGTIAGAGLDVFDQEPLPKDHPLRSAPRTVLTPHIGYVTQENYAVFYREAVEDILGFMDGKPLRVLSPGK